MPIKEWRYELGERGQKSLLSGHGSRIDSRQATRQIPSQVCFFWSKMRGSQSCSRTALSNRTSCSNETVLEPHCLKW